MVGHFPDFLFCDFLLGNVGNEALQGLKCTIRTECAGTLLPDPLFLVVRSQYAVGKYIRLLIIKGCLDGIPYTLLILRMDDVLSICHSSMHNKVCGRVAC